MKKKVIITISALLGGILALRHVKGADKEEKIKIGILQMVSHPALDRAKEGFIEKIKEEGSIEIVLQNAEGSMAQARSIAQSFHNDPSIQVIFAIATGAAQTAVAVEKEKPVLFAAITDPVKANIIQKNSCGTSDLIDVAGEVELLRKLFPHAKKVAIPFNPSEVNSAFLVDKMKKELEKQGLESQEIGIHHESEVTAAITKASLSSDVLLVPTDNLLANAFSLVAQTAAKQKKAVIASDNLLVEKGAIAAKGVDYFDSGKKAAEMALEILLHDKKPMDFPIVTSEKTKAVLNEKILLDWGIDIPKDQEIVLVNRK